MPVEHHRDAHLEAARALEHLHIGVAAQYLDYLGHQVGFGVLYETYLVLRHRTVHFYYHEVRYDSGHLAGRLVVIVHHSAVFFEWYVFFKSEIMAANFARPASPSICAQRSAIENCTMATATRSTEK